MSDRPTDNLYRSLYVPGAVQIRNDAGTEGGPLARLDILFARFNQWNEIDSYYEGRFLERLAPGAFTKTMQERAGSIVSLFNHGHDPQIGDKVLGEIVDMGERADGPFIHLDLDDTSYNRDLLPALARGAYGASYMFRVIKEEWNDAPDERPDNPLGLPERIISEVKLYEAGPVTFPADETTIVGLRSETDRFNSTALRLAQRAAEDGTRGDGGAATSNEPIEPANGHSSGLTIDQARARLIELGAA